MQLYLVTQSESICCLIDFPILRLNLEFEKCTCNSICNWTKRIDSIPILFTPKEKRLLSFIVDTTLAKKLSNGALFDHATNWQCCGFNIQASIICNWLMICNTFPSDPLWSPAITLTVSPDFILNFFILFLF